MRKLMRNIGKSIAETCVAIARTNWWKSSTSIYARRTGSGPQI